MEKTKPVRIWELDFLRGFAIIMMVFDHLMYDLKSMPGLFDNFWAIDNNSFNWLYDLAISYWKSDLRAGGHYVFVFIFLIVSGISFNFSHNNFARSLKFVIVAILISAVTIAIEDLSGGTYNFAIYFGIIHLFGVGTLLTLALRKIWDNDLFMLTIGLVIVGFGIYMHFWDVKYFPSLDFGRFFLMVLGFKGYGADFFGLAPYAGAIMIGAAIGRHLYPERRSLLPSLDGKWNRPFKASGRNALAIFIVHQPLIMLFLGIVAYLFGYRI